MSRIFPRVVLFAAVAGLAVVPGVSQAAVTKVKAVDTNAGFAFTPAKIKVLKGSTVKWLGKSSMIHQISFYKKPAKMRGFTLVPDEFQKRTFKVPGVYRYRCTFDNHSTLSDGTCLGMCGQVKVTKP